MFFLFHYTQINPKINPCKIKFVVEGAVYNALRLMWAIGIGSFVILTSNNNLNYETGKKAESLRTDDHAYKYGVRAKLLLG